MLECKICNSKFSTLRWLSRHLTDDHGLKILNYYIDYENFIIPKCSCGDNLKYIAGTKFQSSCGKRNCLTKSFSIINKNNMTEETKLKISNTRKKLFKEGKLLGWSINKDINRRSYPEKFFIKLMEMNELFNKYTIIEKMPYSKYFLDFAFIELKTDVEIDGQQHFISENSIKYDIERDDFLIENGWSVYRISWIELKNNPKEIINDFINWLVENNKYRKYNVVETLEEIKLKKEHIKNKSKEKQKEKRREKVIFINENKIKKEKKEKKEKKYIKSDYKKRKNYFNKRKIQYNNKILPIIEKIKESDINFSKYGWVKEVSKIIGIHENKGGWWMKRNMNDFYIKNCWKRNATII